MYTDEFIIYQEIDPINKNYIIVLLYIKQINYINVTVHTLCP